MATEEGDNNSGLLKFDLKIRNTKRKKKKKKKSPFVQSGASVGWNPKPCSPTSVSFGLRVTLIFLENVLSAGTQKLSIESGIFVL